MEQNWQELLRKSVRTAEELKEILNLTEEETRKMDRIIQSYPLCINPYYLGLVNREDPGDPIRKMCMPDGSEFSEGGAKDTSGEASNTVMQGLQHKYRQTALILSTNQCAMYCRHCFRKRMVGLSSDEVVSHLPAMADYVRQHTEIDNVLISGGDSFLNANEVIEKYLKCFTEVDHLDYIRFGTRTPVVLPQRISGDEELLRMLQEYGRKKQLVIVTQFNHPREITEESSAAVRMLREIGCIVRNQMVLLKGVNDDEKVIAGLMNGLMAIGVIPYYIFQCRPVAGVHTHFQVPLSRGIELVEKAKADMNGQSKSVRYVMSHPTGKIEILGRMGEKEMLFKYHQAKYEKDLSRIFCKQVEEDQRWLDEI